MKIIKISNSSYSKLNNSIQVFKCLLNIFFKYNSNFLVKLRIFNIIFFIIIQEKLKFVKKCLQITMGPKGIFMVVILNLMK